jgi:hypothetical protein
MNIDFEQQLRAEMKRAPIRPRPGVVREAYRHSRRRTHAMRAAATVGVAAVTAAATATTVTALGASGPARRATETTASLAVHISRALTASQGIMAVREVTIQPDGYSGTYYTWTYGDRTRNLHDDTSGKPDLDVASTTTTLPDGRVKTVTTNVDYHARTVTKGGWVASPLPWPWGERETPASCAVKDRGGLSLITLTQSTPDGMSSTIRTLLTCDKSITIGHKEVGGTQAITITYRYPSGDPQVLYVNESTYLPFELESPTLTGPYRGGGEDFYFSWLPATQTNLAQLTPPIPPGFRVIVTPLQVSTWPPPKCSIVPQPHPSHESGTKPQPLKLKCGTR